MRIRNTTQYGLVALILLSGCSDKKRPIDLGEIPAKEKVIAQGQILPKAGIVRLSAAPGDIVEEVDATVGADVDKGKELVVMRSAALRVKQIRALEVQKKAAEQEAKQKIAQASQQVRIAHAKLENVKSMKASLPRKAELLEIASKQLKAAEKVLEKLVDISKSKLTKEFVGGLEIDRQKMAVQDAELKYRQQKEVYDQAKDDVTLAMKAATIELEVAEELKASAEAFSPADVLDAQIATLRQEMIAAKILAPFQGRILSVNARPGEAGVPQIPLIEMADLSTMVVEVEINDRDAARVKKGQKAEVKSRAFEGRLPGKVAHVYAMVGKPQLKPLDPLARKDYRAKIAVIELDSPSKARDWLQLQVEVTIVVAEESGQSTKASGENSGKANKGSVEKNGKKAKASDKSDKKAAGETSDVSSELGSAESESKKQS
ncbi:MAG: efflux RND transporter periplasmic adaptor subunit [Planctomycetota bacterium]